MTKGSFVSVNRTRRREIVKILRQRPLHIAFVGAGNQADVRSDFEPAYERPGGRFEQSLFWRAESESDRGANGRAFRLSGVRVQTGRHVNRQHRNSRAVDLVDQFDPGAFQRTVQSDAKQSVDDQHRRQGKE